MPQSTPSKARNLSDGKENFIPISAGVLLTSASALMLEVTLTRIFSVRMWYHFAFLSVSMALMGSAVAGIALYFLPALARDARRWVGWGALALAIAAPLTFIIYLNIPFNLTLWREGLSFQQGAALALIYINLTIPFFLSGMALSLALSAWSGQAGRVYWADLTGAALGCLGSILALEALGGAGAMLAVGVVAALAGLAFVWRERRARLAAVGVLAATVALLWGNATQNWIVISVNKMGGEERPRIYERWNAYSRISVYEIDRYPFYWSVDMRYWDKVTQEGRYLNHALLLIDAVAGTPIQEFRGLLHEEEFLRYDLSSFVYHVVERPNTFIIGPGGGRDVLAALASGAPHVTAVEVNPAIVEAVRGPFGEFSGHLYDRPDVTIVVDDARGYIARSPERYDVIQASLIDTWAAGGSGAFALSENSLYTVEAFKTYYDHLTDRGILTISRWYLDTRPAETLRLVSTAIAGWRRAGVADPRAHIVVVSRPNNAGRQFEGMATAFFKRTPFTAQEIALIQERAAELGFDIVYLPGRAAENEVTRFINSSQEEFIAAYPLDISPATDDRPFFFNLVRFGDLMDPSLKASGVYQTSVEAISILATVIAVTAGLGVAFVILPLWLGARRKGLPRPSNRMLLYFAALGLAFMLIEIPAIQQLTVYLGRPVYSLAIVLFSLLLFSGLGSLWSGRFASPPPFRRVLFTLAALILLFAAAGSGLLHATIGLPLAARMVIAVLLLAPLGFLMGMPFPLGLRWAGERQPGVIPWLWGVNGVMSVLGSALSITLAIHIGFRLTALAAAAVYALAGATITRET